MSHRVRTEFVSAPGSSPVRWAEVWAHHSVSRAGERRWETRSNWELDAARILAVLDLTGAADLPFEGPCRDLRRGIERLLAGELAVNDVIRGAGLLEQRCHSDGAAPEGFFDEGGVPHSWYQYGANWATVGRSVQSLLSADERANWGEQWPLQQARMYQVIEAACQAIAAGDLDEYVLVPEVPAEAPREMYIVRWRNSCLRTFSATSDEEARELAGLLGSGERLETLPCGSPPRVVAEGPPEELPPPKPIPSW